MNDNYGRPVVITHNAVKTTTTTIKVIAATVKLTGPRCQRCGTPLRLAPQGPGEPSIDAMNLATGSPVCQRCLFTRG